MGRIELAIWQALGVKTMGHKLFLAKDNTRDWQR